jgi:putative oxidoreductase
MPIPTTWSPRLLSMMRIVVALVFFSHGISKFFGLPPFPIANGGEAAVLYCFVFLYLAAAGGGAWSVDAGRGRG